MTNGADKLAVVVRNVGVQYDLRLSRQTTMKRTFADFLSRRRTSHETVKFWALRDVSFAVKRGEVVGVIGANGAGKTTLMMAIAGILPVDEGAVFTFGKTSSLFSLGTGFDPEISGRENIFLNGAFLGIPRKAMEQKVDEIVEFSELGAFIDAPLRTYSAGMRSRLSFSIAVHIEPEILLLDEIMGGGVGDAVFQAKSEAKVHELMDRAKAIIVVTHSTGYVTNRCTKAIWLDQGSIVRAGDPQDVTEAYLDHARSQQAIRNGRSLRSLEPGAVAQPLSDSPQAASAAGL